MANVKISGNYVAPENTKGATGTKIIAYNKSAANIYDALNGGMYNNNWKFMSVIKDGETVGNGQMSLTGMKLLWNCPDATAVSASCYNGHIVAPSAAIEISGGNFEGGVIGKTIDTGGDSEAHFYPYNAVPKNTGAATYSVSFVKQKTGDADTKLGGAKFNLYSSYTAASSATKDDTDATADYVGTKTSAVTTGAFAFDGLEAGSYFMKEVAAPANYELSDTIYKITVGTSGTAVAPATSASETGAALTATSNAYSIENALTPTASDIKLIKTVSGTNSAESDAKDAKFTLYTTSACSNIVQGTTETAASKVENDYTVTFKGENLNVNNTYYLKETTAPTGYTASTNIYECHIKADGTVEYRIWTSGNINTFSEDFPICDNVKNTPPDPNAYNVEYKKVDSQTKIALENCEFALYHDAACTNPVMKNGANYTAKSDANGITRFENIQAGKYYFKEISAPYGYTLNPQTYIVEIIAGTPPVITFGYLGGAQGLNQLSVPNDPISPVIPYNPSTPAITVPYNPPYISFPNELLPGGVKTYPVVPAVSDHEITVDVAPDAGILVEEMSVVTAVTTAPGAVSDAASDSPSAGTNIPWAAGTMLIAAIGVLLFAIKH